jgi:dihydropteroate synthase-like protein
VPTGIDRVILPGWCEGDLAGIEQNAGVPVELGPKDLRDLPEHFGARRVMSQDYGAYNIETIAEINHCPRLAVAEILAMARQYRSHGADVIDVGCDPGGPWLGVADVVRRLRDEGLRVSIDSFNRREVELAISAGVELVLSVNSSNVDIARDWPVEVVVVPDEIPTLGGLDRTLERLEAAGVRYRIDPVIEPIGFGFAASLGRYFEVRRRWPQSGMMMGVGNITELTDADSAAINALLIGICQELGIHSVLTTQVINWARSSIREIDVARRLMYYCVKNRLLPKHVDTRLVMLRDPKVHEHGQATLNNLASRITDPNFRIFAERGEIHLMNSRGYWHGTDPFEVFSRALQDQEVRTRIDPTHAFYLGYEMAKAVAALTLNKEYRQDQPLDWGLLTRPEVSHQANKALGEG